MYAFHHRLDLRLHASEYLSSRCGSKNARTGRQEYCAWYCHYRVLGLVRRFLAAVGVL